ncbi:hypothetical protein HDU91_006665 [Kappamyces sp. JEL0680]|nr:hypothetical protein HDU91_006665 [Kappamyces sp. JEL0680]
MSALSWTETEGSAVLALTTLEWCLDLHIRVVTVYAFSIENFKRSQVEVDTLFDLAEEKFAEFLRKDAFIHQRGICVRVIGDLDMLRPSTRLAVQKLMWSSRNGKNAVLNIACPYTSKHEMKHAAEGISLALSEGRLLPVDVSQHLFDACMFTHEDTLPLDILVRTSGEVRLSDFMLWQASRDTYVHFVDVLWPDFSFWDMLPIMLCFQCNSLFLQVGSPLLTLAEQPSGLPAKIVYEC